MEDGGTGDTRASDGRSAMGRMMRKSSRSQTQGATTWQAIATGLVRPGAEAVLLAGVAFGCAQVGWRLVEPASAGAAPVPPDIAATDTMAHFQSPFAPTASAASTTKPDAVASIRLVGVRMSEQQNLSGAVLTFGDDLQRPFLVGQTISDGVLLSQVHADHIVVSFGDDEQMIAMEQGNASPRSFALALMGKSLQPDIGLIHTADAAPAAQAVSLPESSNTPAGANWLLATMGSVETRTGAPYAWRVSSAPPAALGERNLAPGDLILSVNGARPGDTAAVLAAARASRLELVIERPSGERTTIVLVNGFAS